MINLNKLEIKKNKQRSSHLTYLSELFEYANKVVDKEDKMDLEYDLI